MNFFIKVLFVIALAIPSLSFAQSLPDGCTSTKGFSTTTGQLCAGVNTTIPAACTDLTYFLNYGSRDAEKGGQVTLLQKFLISNGYMAGTVSPTGYFGSGTFNGVKRFQSGTGLANASTPGYGTVGKLTRAKIKEISCGVVTNVNDPQLITTSVPSLTLQYSSVNGEQELVGIMNIKITAGAKDITFPNPLTYSPVQFSLKNTTTGQSAPVTSVSASALGGAVPILYSGQSLSYTIRITANPKQLFAGQYRLEVSNNIINASGNLLPATTTNSNSLTGNIVTIVGEVSPYITKVYSDPSSTTNGYIIEGVRFHATSNAVTINGITKTLPAGNTMNTAGAVVGSNIRFSLSEFGITGPGNYSVRIVHPVNGASNNAYFNIGTVSTTPNPSITVEGTPSLTLRYSSTNGEQELVGLMNVRVRAGTEALQGNAVHLVLKNTTTGVQAPASLSLTAAGGVPTAILPGQEQSYTLEIKANPKQLFAGQYRAEILPTVFTSTYTPLKADVAGAMFSNAVTIVGETSPYITSVVQGTGAYGYGIMAINGARFAPTGNIVNVGTKTFTLPSVTPGTIILLPWGDLGLTSGTYQLQVISPTTGNSNLVSMTIAGGSVSADPQIVVVGTPTLTLTYSGASEAELVATVNAKVTAGSKDLHSTPLYFDIREGQGRSVDVTSTIRTHTALGGIPSGGLKAGQSETYTVQIKVNPKQLFAGQYKAVVSSNLLGMDYSAATANITGVTTSNAITIVGEVSPYISSVTQGAGDPPAVVIKGVRFAPTGNIVTIGSKTITTGSTSSGTQISLDILGNAITTGQYAVQVKHPTTGSSNVLSVSVTAPQAVNTTPTITVNATPTLTLSYSGTSESELVGSTSLTVRAGSVDLGWTPVSIVLRNITTGQTAPAVLSATAAGGVPSVLKAGQSQSYTIRLTANPKQIFAGQYRVEVSPVVFTATGGSLSADMLGSPNFSSVRTVVGEVAPYISSVRVSGDTVFVTGVRFHATTNAVILGSCSRTGIPSTNGTSMALSTVGCYGGAPGVISLQITHPTTGKSNIVGVGIVLAKNETASSVGQMANAIGAFTQDEPVETVAIAQVAPAFSYNWTRNLEIGSGYIADVTALQTALTKEGVFSGEATGGFYNQTYLAAKAFQAKYGIDATGFVGPTTRTKLNSLYGAGI